MLSGLNPELTEITGTTQVVKPQLGEFNVKHQSKSQLRLFESIDTESAGLTASLPIIETCAGCGACCEHMSAPPFWYAADDGELWKLPRRLSNDLIRFRHDHPSLDGTPCRWLDPKTKVCRHYEWRPAACRTFQFGGLDCLRLRHGRRAPAELTAAERAIADAGLFTPLSEFVADNGLYEAVHAAIDEELLEQGVEFEALSYEEVEVAEMRGLHKVAKRLLSETSARAAGAESVTGKENWTGS